MREQARRTENRWERLWVAIIFNRERRLEEMLKRAKPAEEVLWFSLVVSLGLIVASNFHLVVSAFAIAVPMFLWVRLVVCKKMHEALSEYKDDLYHVCAKLREIRPTQCFRKLKAGKSRWNDMLWAQAAILGQEVDALYLGVREVQTLPVRFSFRNGYLAKRIEGLKHGIEEVSQQAQAFSGFVDALDESVAIGLDLRMYCRIMDLMRDMSQAPSGADDALVAASKDALESFESFLESAHGPPLDKRLFSHHERLSSLSGRMKRAITTGLDLAPEDKKVRADKLRWYDGLREVVNTAQIFGRSNRPASRMIDILYSDPEQLLRLLEVAQRLSHGRTSC